MKNKIQYYAFLSGVNIKTIPIESLLQNDKVFIIKVIKNESAFILDDNNKWISIQECFDLYKLLKSHYVKKIKESDAFLYAFINYQ